MQTRRPPRVNLKSGTLRRVNIPGLTWYDVVIGGTLVGYLTHRGFTWRFFRSGTLVKAFRTRRAALAWINANFDHAGNHYLTDGPDE